MLKVSIIVPTLNVVKYIDECMLSVINQTLHDIEIIVIDAGSTDGTLEAVKRYANDDKRIEIICSDKKSYGYQLNLGIEKANGEYVGVVESDDVIELDMYENLYNTAISDDYDFVKGVGRFYWDNVQGNKYYIDLRAFDKDRYTDGKLEFCGSDYGIELLRYDYYLWLGLYKKEFIKNIKLNETPGAAFQDVGFLAQAYYNSKKVCYIDRYVYNYRQTNMSASSVNTKGFRYIRDENRKLSEMDIWKDDNWRRACLLKAFKQADRRFQIMAYQGKYWEDKADEIEEVRQMIIDGEIELKISDRLLEQENSVFELYLKSPRELFERYKSVFDELKDKKKKLIDSMSDKKVVIFGCGLWGEFAGYMLNTNLSDSLVGYTDNSQQLWGTSIYGLPVRDPAEWISKSGELYYLIANKKYANDIKKQLVNAGVSADNIGIYDLGRRTMLL